ncbi:MAG: protein SCO1/2 [Vicingaceae bacterium]|jgi:protein SCO1/2
MSNKVVKKGLILLTILLLPTVAFFILHSGSHNFKAPPIYGPKSLAENGIDTIYHSIPYFEFTNQLGERVTSKDYEGKIYVADFFFATCPTICPKMAVHMLELQKHFYDRNDFGLLSHTINPEHDTVEVLYEYSKKVHSIDSVWEFVTGSKESIASIARNGYFANAMKDLDAEGGFLHSTNFFLIDRKGQIRGIFDGTSTRDIDNCMDAIEILYREEYAPLKKR